MQNSSNELASQASYGSLTAGDTLNSIDNMIGKVEGLKRKVSVRNKPRVCIITETCLQLSDLHEMAGKPTQDVMRERLHHLANVESIQSTSDTDFSRWADTRLDRWLVDWCLRSGKESSARSIAKEKGIEVCLYAFLFKEFDNMVIFRPS